MKNSMFLAFPLFLLSPLAGSLHLMNDGHQPSNIYTIPVDDSVSDLKVQTALRTSTPEAAIIAMGETKIQKSNDPILGPVIFEICYKRCGDPGVIENGPCWFHCRYSFFLLGKRNRK